MRQPKSPAVSLRKTVPYYNDVDCDVDPILKIRRNYSISSYPHMLIEDVSLGIMPIGGRIEKRGIRVSLTSGDELLEGKIAEAFPDAGRYRDFPVAVCEFFRQSAHLVLAYGEAVYEVAFTKEKDSGKISGFELAFVQPKTIYHRLGKVFQYVPLTVAKKHGVPQNVEVDPQTIITMTPPVSATSWEQSMEALVIISDLAMPEFVLKGITAGINTRYDFSNHQVWRIRAIADATKEIGWNTRGTIQEQCLEYYTMYRQLQFERFKIRLRAEILGKLNAALLQAGKVLGFDSQMVISGLPTLEDVSTAEAALKSGSKTFTEIISQFRNY